VTTYRTGNHHGITICAENDGARCGRPDHDCARGHLVAVVVDGGDDSAAFAERICALLNDDAAYWARVEQAQPGLAPGGTPMAALRALADGPGTPDRTYLRGASDALAEVRRRLIVWSKLAEDGEKLSEALAHGILRAAAAELGVDEDAPPSRVSTPVSDLQGSVVGRDRAEAPGRSEGVLHRPERRGSDSEGYGACTGCGDLWPCAGYRGTA
jgi:hypothetical protein